MKVGYTVNQRAEWFQDVERFSYQKYQGYGGAVVAYQGQYENIKGEWKDGAGGELEHPE